MKKVSTWKSIFFLLTLSVLVLLGGNRQVSAAAKCRVTFANYEGKVTTDTYRNWAKTVNSGQTITLPNYSRSGYRCYWEIRTGNKVQKYRPGTKYKVTKSVKFCLQKYKIYEIRFYTGDGKKEYTTLRKRPVKGEMIALPSVPRSSSKTGLGWSTSVKDKNYKKAGTKIKVTGYMKFYARTKTITGVKLYKYNGQFWKTIPANTDSTLKFPSVNLGSANMCLGWSRKIGARTPEFYAGDKIPTKNGKYYMVVFGPEDEKAPAYVRKPLNYDQVYFVGDSRTAQMEQMLGSRKPSNVEFVAKSGMGLNWFKERSNNGGYKILWRKVNKLYKETQGKAKQAVIINLGINDIHSRTSSSTINSYIKYMRAVSKDLKKFKCDVYYMSVNPVNSAMITAYGGVYRTEKQVLDFNKSIYSGLCSGRNKYFTYIDVCTPLRKYGWRSRQADGGLYDGLHYSNGTYLRIYDYCIKYLNR